MNGYININKSINWTSNDVVRKLKSLLSVKKIGHGGTLDPLATGVLPICLNSATRFSEYILHGSKSYLASIKLGESTDTYDSHGNITNQKDYSFITKRQGESKKIREETAKRQNDIKVSTAATKLDKDNQSGPKKKSPSENKK